MLLLLFASLQAAAQKYSFGKAMKGYTQVLPSTRYTAEKGYGFDFSTGPTSTPFYFSVKLPPGKL